MKTIILLTLWITACTALAETDGTFERTLEGALKVAEVKVSKGRFRFYKMKDGAIGVLHDLKDSVRNSSCLFLDSDNKQLELGQYEDLMHTEEVPQRKVSVDDGCIYHLRFGERTNRSCTLRYRIAFTSGEEIEVTVFIP